MYYRQTEILGKYAEIENQLQKKKPLIKGVKKRNNISSQLLA